MLKETPKDATIAITYKCNARCEMCSIWQNKNQADLSLKSFDNLNKDLRYINISGGEPFLRKDLLQIIKKIRENCPGANLIISSNGFNSDLIARQAQEILKIYSGIGIRISIDGVGKIHDEIRGVSGIYNQAVDSLNKLKKIGVKNLGIGFTIMDKNVNEIKKVFDLAEDLDVQFSVSAVQNSQIYFNKLNNRITFKKEISDSLDYIIKKQLKSWSIKKWLRAYYVYGLKFYLSTGKRLIKSGAGIDSLFIDAYGNVYPSNLIDKKIGNLSQKNLRDMWLLKNIESEESEPWTICTVRNSFRKYFLQIGFWIFVNKFLK